MREKSLDHSALGPERHCQVLLTNLLTITPKQPWEVERNGTAFEKKEASSKAMSQGHTCGREVPDFCSETPREPPPPSLLAPWVPGGLPGGKSFEAWLSSRSCLKR